MKKKPKVQQQPGRVKVSYRLPAALDAAVHDLVGCTGWSCSHAVGVLMATGAVTLQAVSEKSLWDQTQGFRAALAAAVDIFSIEIKAASDIATARAKAKAALNPGRQPTV